MRKNIVASVVILLFMLSACSGQKFGSGIDRAAPEKKVKDIFLDSSLLGKVVTLQGKISSQCGSNGCWFVLQDDTGQVFINLAPANLSLTPNMGRPVKVSGTVNLFEQEIQVSALGGELR
ncbi:MAG: DNA-binding protein [Nitrospirae bacterium]|nr:DNA-binding protein [Nitrospirota bacterium]